MQRQRENVVDSVKERAWLVDNLLYLRVLMLHHLVQVKLSHQGCQVKVKVGESTHIPKNVSGWLYIVTWAWRKTLIYLHTLKVFLEENVRSAFSQ